MALTILLQTSVPSLITVILLSSLAVGEIVSHNSYCLRKMIEHCVRDNFAQIINEANAINDTFNTGQVSCLKDEKGWNCLMNGEQWFSCLQGNEAYKFTYKGKVPTLEDEDDKICQFLKWTKNKINANRKMSPEKGKYDRKISLVKALGQRKVHLKNALIVKTEPIMKQRVYKDRVSQTNQARKKSWNGTSDELNQSLAKRLDGSSKTLYVRRKKRKEPETESFSKYLEDLTRIALRVKDAIVAALKHDKDELMQTLKNLKTELENIYEKIRSHIEKTLSDPKVKEKVEKLLKRAKSDVAKIVTGLKEKIENTLKDENGNFKDIKEVQSEILKILFAKAAEIDKILKAYLDELLKTIKDAKESGSGPSKESRMSEAKEGVDQSGSGTSKGSTKTQEKEGAGQSGSGASEESMKTQEMEGAKQSGSGAAEEPTKTQEMEGAEQSSSGTSRDSSKTQVNSDASGDQDSLEC